MRIPYCGGETVFTQTEKKPQQAAKAIKVEHFAAAIICNRLIAAAQLRY